MLGAATIEHSDISERVAQATSDTRALRQLTRLLMTGLAATLMVIAFLFLAGMQAVWLVDQAARDREMAQVIRYINGVPGGMNEIALDAMTRTLGLSGARLAQARDVDPDELSASLVAGSDIVVAWTPQQPGRIILERVAPMRIGASIVFLAVVGIIGWRVLVVSNRLDRRRALATRLAHTDTLTGLGNRRAFDRGLETRLNLAAETGSGLVLVMLDLDDFKAINDRLGHSAGDAVLQIVAQYLREVSAPDDLVVRLGGDEFAVVRQAGGLDDYLAALDARFDQPVRLGGKRIEIAASIGMARSSDFDGDPSRLMQAADIALYRAKRSGRGNAELAVPTAQLRRAAQ